MKNVFYYKIIIMNYVIVKQKGSPFTEYYVLLHKDKVYRFEEYEENKNEWMRRKDDTGEIFKLTNYKEIPILFIYKYDYGYDASIEYQNYREIDLGTLYNIDSYFNEKLWRRFYNDMYSYDLYYKTIKENEEILNKWYKRNVKLCNYYGFNLNTKDEILCIVRMLIKDSCYFTAYIFLYMFYGEEKIHKVEHYMYKYYKKYDR